MKLRLGMWLALACVLTGGMARGDINCTVGGVEQDFNVVMQQIENPSQAIDRRYDIQLMAPVELNKDYVIGIGNNVTIDLKSLTIGKQNAKTLTVKGKNTKLKIVGGEKGEVYGQIKLESEATLELVGGTYVAANKTNSVVSADGTNYTFVATGATFKGGSGENQWTLECASEKGSGFATLTNVVVTCATEGKKANRGISAKNCDLEIVNGTIDAQEVGILVDSVEDAEKPATNSVHVIGGMIRAETGLMVVPPAQVRVKDATIQSAVTNGYAFSLFGTNTLDKTTFLYLEGTNVVVGGIVTNGTVVSGGLFEFEASSNWTERISISGGTYSHVASNDFEEAWIANGYEAAWSNDTCFTVAELPPEPIELTFASGVAIKDPEDTDSDAQYWEVSLDDEDEMRDAGVTVTDTNILSGISVAVGETVNLPTGIAWTGHTLIGWAIYEGDIPKVDPDSVLVKSFELGKGYKAEDFLDEDGNVLGDLHAVWDGDEGASFDGLYNGEREKIMTGGDTYTGYVTDGGQVIGKITVKLGTPRSDGTISVSAKVTITGEGTRSFSGTGDYYGDSVEVTLEDGENTLSLKLDSKSIAEGDYNGYGVTGGVNLFKGSEADKQKGDDALSKYDGRWLFVFSTEDASPEALDKHGEPRETKVEDGDAHAWGYSYVEMEIRKSAKGKVRLSGKLANGKEISATATAIIGDSNAMCVPATCSVYSGKRGGGFGFTAYFRDTAVGPVASVDTNSVSLWDSTMSKKMPFVAEVSYAASQRVADIELPEQMLFCVDPEKPGLLENTDRIGDVADSLESWLPLDPVLYEFGYRQYVDVLGEKDSGYSLKAKGKAPKMKLVDESFIVPGKHGDNYSALKLKYDRKRGTFSGSFRIYSIKENEDTMESHLKKTKVAVSGAIAGGQGWGFGHAKKAGSVPVVLVDAASSNRTTRLDGMMYNLGEDDEDGGTGASSGEEGTEDGDQTGGNDNTDEGEGTGGLPLGPQMP